MEAVYELRVRFGDEAEDIVASECDAETLMLVQGERAYILLPKESAAAFVEKLSAWVSTGGRA